MAAGERSYSGARVAARAAALRSSLGGAPPIAALILDLGGVVVPTLFEAAGDRLPSGPFGEDPRYHAVERGELQERDYWRTLMARRPDIDIAALWREAGPERPELERALERLRGRVKVAALTNDMAHWFGEDWLERFPVIARFDHVVEASQLGVLKPDPEVFRQMAARVGEPASRCLFVDDLAVNLAGAAAAGMQTLLFDVADVCGSIDRMLERLGVRGAPVCAAPVSARNAAPPATAAPEREVVFRMPSRGRLGVGDR